MGEPICDSCGHSVEDELKAVPDEAMYLCIDELGCLERMEKPERARQSNDGHNCNCPFRLQPGRHIHVDQTTGVDENSGTYESPKRTVKAALESAESGDAIYVAGLDHALSREKDGARVETRGDDAHDSE